MALRSPRSGQSTCAHRYFDGVAAELGAKSIEVQTAVVTGPVAESIVRWAQEHGGDLIALMSHGLGRSAR